MGVRDSLRFLERLRERLVRMRNDVEGVISDYATPSVTVGDRRKLYMSDMIDHIATVRRRVSVRTCAVK